MKNHKLVCTFIFAFALLQLFAFPAFANSSWVWISETRPYDVLPWVVIGTLAIETVSLFLFAKLKKGWKPFIMVTIANAVSFAMPYLLPFILSDSIFPFEYYLEHSPSYTVGLLFCLITVFVELPIVYFTLNNDAPSNKRLFFTIVLSNVVTTALVAITERIFCVGMW
jgi:hypothetical protein